GLMFKVFERWVDRYFAEEEAVLVAVLLILAVAIVVTMGIVLAPMFTAMIIAFLLQGMVTKLTRLGVPHLGAVIVAFLTLVGIMTVSLLVLLPAMWKQVLNLVTETPRMIREGQSLLMLLPDMYPQLITPD